MALEVLAPSMPNVVSQGFEHERLFWSKLGSTLLLRNKNGTVPVQIRSLLPDTWGI